MHEKIVFLNIILPRYYYVREILQSKLKLQNLVILPVHKTKRTY